MSFILIQEQLSSLSLGPLRYFDSTGSTNDEGARWAEEGAPHLALVVADEQTAGRGRMGRRWFTPAGSALAFSLVLRPEKLSQANPEILRFTQKDKQAAQPDSGVTIPRLTGLGALAVCTALEKVNSLRPQIKWPNDVLLGGRKLCGVLPELIWQGELPQAAILGIGINIAPESVPPGSELLFPATCVEAELGRKIDRWVLLQQVLSALLGWLPRLASTEFLQTWESHLAYQENQVQLGDASGVEAEGLLVGLDSDGSLRLKLPSGQLATFQAGELRLRPGADQPD